MSPRPPCFLLLLRLSPLLSLLLLSPLKERGRAERKRTGGRSTAAELVEALSAALALPAGSWSGGERGGVLAGEEEMAVPAASRSTSTKTRAERVTGENICSKSESKSERISRKYGNNESLLALCALPHFLIRRTE